MVGPLVLVHPPKQHIEELDERLFVYGEGVLVVLVFFYDLVGDVDDVRGLMRFPVGVLVSSFYEESQVIQEASDHLFLFSGTAHNPQEVTRHVLAGLIALAELETFIIFRLFVGHSFF